MKKNEKPLGHKAYGSIPHLPGSRLGSGDHHCSPGQARICVERARDKHDRIIIQEKLDGSCCSVAKKNGAILALGRAGYLAETSPFEMHHVFAKWVKDNEPLFSEILDDGERVVGEWLALAHGTRYMLTHEPFVAFDIMTKQNRIPYDDFTGRIEPYLPIPHVISIGNPVPIGDVVNHIGKSGHGAVDPVEGAVWRVERKGVVDFLAKYVRRDKVDGLYLPGCNGNEKDSRGVWNYGDMAWYKKRC